MLRLSPPPQDSVPSSLFIERAEGENELPSQAAHRPLISQSQSSALGVVDGLGGSRRPHGTAVLAPQPAA
ncbi:hypothetical protein NDU88_006519 [Pleurodeles waltl]|uniref:Uncharacterized protein n=1 Tax=Pleurodeles waltl TaxID=8319 RepID=A0AAV7NQF5_PLEWA|nr:hypothetical protein NDU88_006519 [Pleurodeles waltl]